MRSNYIHADCIYRIYMDWSDVMRYEKTAVGDGICGAETSGWSKEKNQIIMESNGNIIFNGSE